MRRLSPNNPRCTIVADEKCTSNAARWLWRKGSENGLESGVDGVKWRWRVREKRKKKDNPIVDYRNPICIMGWSGLCFFGLFSPKADQGLVSLLLFLTPPVFFCWFLISLCREGQADGANKNRILASVRGLAHISPKGQKGTQTPILAHDDIVFRSHSHTKKVVVHMPNGLSILNQRVCHSAFFIFLSLLQYVDFHKHRKRRPRRMRKRDEGDSGSRPGERP